MFSKAVPGVIAYSAKILFIILEALLTALHRLSSKTAPEAVLSLWKMS